jgi:superfamily I DNA/RNA helicase
MQTLIDDDKLKQLLKEAIIEAIEEKRNLFYDLIVDAVEDIAIVRAIQEGENTETISKQEIFNILEDQA